MCRRANSSASHTNRERYIGEGGESNQLPLASFMKFLPHTELIDAIKKRTHSALTNQKQW